MSDPEIARRCSACGASVRPHALFCPHCGQALPQQKPLLEADTIEIPPAVKVEPNRSVAETADTVSIDASKVEPLVNEPLLARERAASHGRASTGRVTVAVRAGSEGGVRGRVDKIRRVSSDMIDQAAYDPSLRFLLVAAVLFFLFLMLLVLSEVIR